MVVLVVLVLALVVVVLVLRSTMSSSRPGARSSVRPRRGRRAQRPPSGGRPVAPDDDAEFLRELERRAKREDGSPGA